MPMLAFYKQIDANEKSEQRQQHGQKITRHDDAIIISGFNAADRAKT